jgi:hypothetical protein
MNDIKVGCLLTWKVLRIAPQKAPKPATSKVGRESLHWFLQFSPRLIPWLVLGSIVFGP